MVFVNLLSNAVDAIIQKKSQEGKVKIELFDFRTNYICKISDNGIGMEQDVVKNIFKPFYTTKSKTGLGYGMFFVSSVCSAHKIKINVTSKKEYGTTFTLVIPKLTQGVD
jgi:signal transduction histidine kinase